MLYRLLPKGTLSFVGAVALFFALQMLANWSCFMEGFRDGWNDVNDGCQACEAPGPSR